MRRIIIILLALSLHASAWAQKNDSILSLRGVVVTGTRTAKTLKDTPILTQVISATDIRRSDATNIVDLLQQYVPGIEFTYAMNQQLHLNYSGFGGQSVLFLVDGERMAGETLDDVDFARLDMANVARVEMVKGAASALYGSQAAGGVINLVSCTETEPWTLGYDYHRERRQGRHRLRWTIQRRRFSNVLTLSAQLNEAYHLKNAAAPAAQVVRQVYGDSCMSIQERLTWVATEGLTLTGRAGYFQREVARAPFAPDQYRNVTSGLRAQYNLTADDRLELSYAFDQYDKAVHYIRSQRTVRQYSNSVNALRGLYSHHTSYGDVLFGGDYAQDYLLNKRLDGECFTQHTADAFVQYDWFASERWEVVGALRYDYFSDGSHSRLTPKLSASYQPQQDLRLRMGYGMGFRAPSLKEKYYDFDMAGIWVVKGSPALRSEISHHLSVSADYSKDSHQVVASAYYNKVKDKLATGVPYYDDMRQLSLNYINLDNYLVYGGDVMIRSRWTNGLGASMSYAYTHEQQAKDKDGNDVRSQYLPARRHALTVRADWERQLSGYYGLQLSLSGRVLSGVEGWEYVDYYDVSQGLTAVYYPAYMLWRLSTTQSFGTAFRLTLAVDNLLNYQPRYYYYNSPITEGAALMATLSVDINRLF